MKKLRIIPILLVGLLIFSSCQEKELGPVANTTDPGAPAISSPEYGESFTLDRTTPNDTLLTIEWSKPDYGFASAPTYIIELAAAGSNFAEPVEVARVSQQTSYSVTVSELNQLLLGAGFEGGQAHDLELRVMASLPDESVSQAVSETVTLTVTPFLTDFPPIYMIGAALKGWSLDAAVITPSSDPNVYTTLAEFTGGEAFRFFAEPDWNAENWNYPYFADNGGDIDELLVNANDGDSNFQFTGTTGWYRITVNMGTYSVQMEQAEEPVMYMTGEAVGAWDTPGTGESVKMTFVQEGVFEAITDFSTAGAANFRFFAQADWAPDSYNYPYFADNNGEIDELLINAEDGDSNFEFTGSDGTYYIKVDINNYIVEMEAQ